MAELLTPAEETLGTLDILGRVHVDAPSPQVNRGNLVSGATEDSNRIPELILPVRAWPNEMAGTEDGRWKQVTARVDEI